MRVKGRSDDGQVVRWTSGESQSELDSVGRETCSFKNYTKLHSGLDEDYLDSNEEDGELEETHVKFEPLTHKSEKDEDYDEDEVDQEV